MNTIKRTLSLAIALVLILAMVPVAYAASVTEKDTYALTRNGDNLYQYSSPYANFYYLEGEVSGYYYPVLYTMQNAQTGKELPAYCTDIMISAVKGASYRRLNLEDSHFAASAAGLIRAMVLNGFYIAPVAGESDADHRARVNAKLETLGKAAGVSNLTIGEALAGTQLAIWQVAHGSILSFDANIRSYAPASVSTKYAALCDEELSNLTFKSKNYLSDESIAYVSSQVNAVYNYLLSLDPVAPKEKVVSPASFIDLNDPIFTANEDRTYNVTVTTTVDVHMESGDSLTLEATLGNQAASTSLQDGKQTISLTLSNVPAEQYQKDVYLTISGYQTASGVFLFDAESDRSASQTMVAMDDSQMPVYTRVRAEEERVLRFKKTTPTNLALEGIIFDIYPVMTMEEYLSGKELPEPGDFTTSKYTEYTVITDANGEASVNFTHFGLPDSVYLIVERQHPAIVAPVEPFYVMFPGTSASGTGYVYEITVHPKNQVKGSVTVEKDINSLGNNSASAGVYETHTWIISATIPDDITNGKSYVIADTLDNRLDYVGNMIVNVETTDGQTIVTTLTANIDYALTVTDVNSLEDTKPSDSFKLELTNTGMSNIANALGSNAFSNYSLRVYYDAQLNANAEMGVETPNEAKMEYVNSVNVYFSDNSDLPVVYTGGANLKKVDEANHKKALSGAVFEVYRAATQEEVAAGQNLVKLNDVAGSVVKVSFYDNAQLAGSKVTSVTSNADGIIAIYGLPYGTYYLVETQAPAGYNLMGNTVTLTIDETSHTEEKIAILENRMGTVLPETGGIGTTVYTLSGILLMGISVLLILSKKRKSAF